MEEMHKSIKNLLDWFLKLGSGGQNVWIEPSDWEVTGLKLSEIEVVV